MANKRAAVFLDRDGTINVDHGYLYEIDQFQFIPGTITAMLKLKKMGFALIIVTNQSGIARGKFTESQFLILTEWMDWSLADRGVDLDGIYYCPHHPQGSVKDYTLVCNCRKPEPGMFITAQRQLNIDFATSWMVGDKRSDLLAAQAAGIKNRILVRSGKPITQQDEVFASKVIDSLADFPDIMPN